MHGSWSPGGSQSNIGSVKWITPVAHVIFLKSWSLKAVKV